MTRKRCRRRVTIPMPPRGLRRKLDAAQVRDLGLTHAINLDAIARGTADADTMWQWAGGVLTWARAAELLGVGEAEMCRQVVIARELVSRYKRIGKVGFSGLDYQFTKEGLQIMDQLIELVDLPTATIASEWAEIETNRLKECGV